MKSVDSLNANGIHFELITLKEAVHTAQDVAVACDCSVAQVLKTMLFIGKQVPVIAIVAGDARVDSKKLGKLIGNSSLRMATADEVNALTGYEVGSVSPFGLQADIQKVLDDGVFGLEAVYVGSGVKDVIIRLDSAALQKAWDGVVAPIIKY
ncbi:MAG TPA: YbaK/EbsC family protein [Actinocrinis sp.]|nr:YbaK/EbsC family protein [Actinocrinis sp.]